MKTKNQTKKALLMSAMSLLLCFSMLIGTTFAWFTDSVSTTNNIIVAGNLDVELYYATAEDVVAGQIPDNAWKKVNGDTNVFKDNLWEPGHTEVVYLKVVNEGTLSLKYQLGVNVESEITSTNVLDAELKLSDHIKYGVLTGAQIFTRDDAVAAVKDNATKLNQAYNSGTIKLDPETATNTDNEDIVTMVVYMPTSVGNEANYKKGAAVPKINLGINLFATQVEAEEDSYGPDYDKDAIIASAPVAIPTEDVTAPVTLTAADVAVEVPAAVINALPAEVTSIALAYSVPETDNTSNTVSFASVELVDQDGNKIDLTGNTEPIAVTLPAQTAIATGETVAIFHDGVLVANPQVSANGTISYTANHFCEVTVVEGVAVTNAAELAAAVANGGKIAIANDITIATQLEITSDTVINGVGHTLTYTGAARAINVNNAASDADLTINDLSVICANASFCERGISYNDSAALTLNNVTVTGTNVNYPVNLPAGSKNAKVTINDSNLIGNMALNVWGENVEIVANNTNFRSYYPYSETEACVVIKFNDNSEVAANGCKLTVKGGSIISDANTVAVEVIAKNVTVEISPETKVVGSMDDVIVALVLYKGYNEFYSCTTLKRALELATNVSNATIKLMKDIELTESLVIDGTVVIDLNGHSITGTVGRDAENNRIHTIINNGNLTISNGTVASAGLDGGSAIYNEADATLTIEDVTLYGAPQSDPVYEAGVSKPFPSYVINNFGTLTVKGATIKSYHGAIATGGNGVTVINDADIDVGLGQSTGITSYAIYSYENAQVTVNGGKFAFTKQEIYVNGGNTFCELGTNPIIINGGTYINTSFSTGADREYVISGGTFDKDPSKYLAKNYKATNNGNGTWTVFKGDVVVKNSEELAAAIAAGHDEIVLADGEYDVYGCGGKTLTITGSKKAVLKVKNEGEDGCDYAFGDPSNGVGNVTFNGVTIDTTENTGNYKGYAYMKGTFNDCNFVGAYSLNNANNFVFNNCTFDFMNGYFWTWGAKSVTFNSCTFNGNSKNILAHGWESTVININNCTFAAAEKGYAGGGLYWTAAVEIDPAGSNTYTINFTGENTINENYSGWTRVKDDSTGHTITGLN